MADATPQPDFLNYTKYFCVANDFNRFDVPWNDIDVFVSNIDWNDSGLAGTHFTTLGSPGEENSIQIGVDNQPNTWTPLTSTDPHHPTRFTHATRFKAVVVTGDSYQQDNTGGYWIHVRRHI